MGWVNVLFGTFKICSPQDSRERRSWGGARTLVIPIKTQKYQYDQECQYTQYVHI